MTLPATIDGIFLATAALLAGLSSLFMLARRRVAGECALAAASLAALAAVVLACFDGAWPMGNLGSVFAVMTACVWPVAVVARRVCGAQINSFDAVWAFVLAVPAAFVFPAKTGEMAAILRSPLFGPHVFSCLLAYMLGLKAAFAAVKFLMSPASPAASPLASPQADNAARYHQIMADLALSSLVFLTAGLVVGSYWGSLAWGSWWNYDPKELLTLSAWLMLAASLIFSEKSPRSAAVAVLFAAALMLVTLTLANISRIFAGLHSYA